MNQGMLDALTEKNAAEQMILSNDFATARDHLLRAQQQFPANENIGPMLTLCDILTAARVELPGCGVDHYWVLQVMPSSTCDDIKNQYQKLVTLLQPVSTKFPSTKFALKLLQDAFIILRDQKKRSEFDLKRTTSWENYRFLDLQASTYQTSPNKKMVERDKKVDLVKLPSDLQPTTLEKKTSSLLNTILQQRSFQDFYNFDSYRKFQNFEAGQIWAVNSRANLCHNYLYARIDSTSEAGTFVTWLKPIPISSSERSWCDADMPVACGSFEVNLEMQMKTEVRWAEIVSYKCSWTPGVTDEQFEIYPRKGEIWAVYKDWDIDDWSYNPDSIKRCKFELIEIISDFSKYSGAYGACLVKVDGFKCIFERQKIGGSPITFHIPPKNLYIFSHKILAYRLKGRELDKVTEGMYELDHTALPDYLIQEAKISELTFQEQFPSPISPPQDKILMPKWSRHDFIAGEIWSIYCGEDNMPRQYARVNNTISENQVSVTFLEPLPVLEHEIEWTRHGLPMVCGMFKVGERSAKIGMFLFCYLVKYRESMNKSCYIIYPQKGEIWATYKGWSPNWKRAEYRSCQCQIVRIVSDFSEGDEMSVSRLVEVKGCLTFFHVQKFDQFDLIHRVSRTDMLSFSHQIPAFRVPGIGKYGIPESSFHLEPLALPWKLNISK